MKADIYFKDSTPPWEASDEVNVQIDDNWVTAEYKDNLYYYPMQKIRLYASIYLDLIKIFYYNISII